MHAGGAPAARLELVALAGIPPVRPGDDLAALIAAALEAQRTVLVDGDVLVVAQKIVSKAENRFVDLASIEPSPRARELAAVTGKDPRLVEVVLGESRRVVRARRDVLIVEHRLGFVMANAGVDQSNVGRADGRERVLLLPADPDASAEALCAAIRTRSRARIAVIVNDSFGRAWRRGSVGVALGAAGLPAIVDKRGDPDWYGRALRVTTIGYADEIAAAASLLMGQADEGRPVVLVRGLSWSAPDAPAAAIIRPADEDLFR